MSLEEHIRKVCPHYYDASMLQNDHDKARFLMPRVMTDYALVGHSAVVLSDLPKTFPWIERPFHKMGSVLENITLILPVTMQEVMYHVLRLENRSEIIRDMDHVMYTYICEQVIMAIQKDPTSVSMTSAQLEIEVVTSTKVYVDDYLQKKYPAYRMLRLQHDTAIATYMAYLSRDPTHVHDASIMRFIATIQGMGFRSTETGSDALDELHHQQLQVCLQERKRPYIAAPLPVAKKRKKQASIPSSSSHPLPPMPVSIHSVE